MGLKPRRAVRMQLNLDVELSFLATRHFTEWRPTAAIILSNNYLGIYIVRREPCLLVLQSHFNSDQDEWVELRKSRRNYPYRKFNARGLDEAW